MLFKVGCQLKNGLGNGCRGCTIRQLVPVTESVITKHLSGTERIMLYLPNLDGSSSFAAIDFDNKGRPDGRGGMTFDDVRVVSDLLNDWGVAHGVARSTGNGFHLVTFFGEPVPASLSRSLLLASLERTGLAETARRRGAPPLEVFPKQIFVEPGSFGNGIRPPMVMSRFELRRNGWVDHRNVWIGEGLTWQQMVEAQWAHFASIPNVSLAKLEQVIAAQGIDVTEQRRPRSERPSRMPGSPSNKGHGAGSERYDWERFGRVLSGCEALRAVVEKAPQYQLGHYDGHALISIVSFFKGWRSWFTKTVKNWDVSEKDRQQIDKFAAKALPMSCRRLQEHGICPHRHSEHCLPRQPQDDGPGPDPSPLRFATQPTQWGALARELLADPEARELLEGVEGGIVCRASVPV
jgi:hypothetical protein